MIIFPGHRHMGVPLLLCKTAYTSERSGSGSISPVLHWICLQEKTEYHERGVGMIKWMLSKITNKAHASQKLTQRESEKEDQLQASQKAEGYVRDCDLGWC